MSASYACMHAYEKGMAHTFRASLAVHKPRCMGVPAAGEKKEATMIPVGVQNRRIGEGGQCDRLKFINIDQ